MSETDVKVDLDQAGGCAAASSEKFNVPYEQLRELVAQTLASYAGDTFSSTNIVFEENSAPWPSSYSPREQQSLRMLADCVLETIAGAQMTFSNESERTDVSLNQDFTK